MASSFELLIVTVVGVCVVFAALILLALIILGFRYLFYKETATKNVKEQLSTVPEIKKEDDVDANQKELVAVIAAAIACANPEVRFIVRNISWVADISPEWRRIAKQEHINSNRMIGR